MKTTKPIYPPVRFITHSQITQWWSNFNDKLYKQIINAKK